MSGTDFILLVILVSLDGIRLLVKKCTLHFLTGQLVVSTKLDIDLWLLCPFSLLRPLQKRVQWLARTFDFAEKGREEKWTASVHTLHMSKPLITFVFKVLRNGLLRYILYTCPNL